MVVALLAVTLVAMTGTAVLSRGANESRFSKSKIDSDMASYAAMAGLEHCMGYLVWDPAAVTTIEALTSYPTTVCTASDSFANGSSYTAYAVAESGTDFRVVSTGRAGRVPRVSTRTVSVVLRYNPLSSVPGLSYGGEVSLAYGTGNVTIEGESEIDGDLYSYGDIYFAGNAKACGTYSDPDYPEWPTGHDGPDLLREDCVNRFIDEPVNKPVFETLLEQVPDEITFATLPTTLPGHEFYRFTGDFAIQCPAIPSESRPRHDYCDGPADLRYAAVVYVTGKLTLGKMGSVHDQHFTGNVIFLATTGVDLDATNITRDDAVVDGVTKKTVLQVMTEGGDIKFASTKLIEGHLVNHTKDAAYTNVTIKGLVIAENWNFNNSRLIADSYLITKLTRPGAAAGTEDPETPTEPPGEDPEPQWAIIEFS